MHKLMNPFNINLDHSIKFKNIKLDQKGKGNKTYWNSKLMNNNNQLVIKTSRKFNLNVNI